MGGRRLRALVCDDDAGTSRALGAILARRGFEVVATVASSSAALLTAELSSPDLVVVDLAVTGDLGVGVVRAFRAALPDCAIIVLSPFDSLRGPALTAGAYDVVSNARSDLRGFERCLTRLSDELDDGPAAVARAAVPAPPRRSG